jgi:predicted acyl esterase
LWVTGENKWRTYEDWPVPGTQWTKFYLDSWERLTTEEALPFEQTQSYNPEPDVFTQMPLKKTMKVERLRYMTEPLPDDLLVVGPCSLTIHAALGQDDQLDHRPFRRRAGRVSPQRENGAVRATCERTRAAGSGMQRPDRAVEA